MLYHLINMNPQKDITLHVSTNNSAMVGIPWIQVENWRANICLISFYTINLDLKQKNSSRDSIPSILTRIHDCQQMHSSFAFDICKIDPTAAKSI